MFRLSIVVILLAATLSTAQKLDDRDYKVRVDVELVQLPVSVLDKKGFPIRDLQQEYFAVFEDKILQNISLFKQEDIPLSVGLVVDTSSSMYDKLDKLNSAAMTFVQESNPKDETAVVSFGSGVDLVQDFTTDQAELNNALQGIVPHGMTAFYDAVVLAANHLAENGAREKKVLFVISDGEDNQSRYSLEDAVKAITELKVSVYSIGLSSPYDAFNSSALSGRAKKALKQLAEVTGGEAFFPGSVKDVQKVCARVARDLRNQYTIGYRPSNDKLDGSWRKTVVKLNLPKTAPKAQVRTKQGYYAPLAAEARR
jgi:VWFA-related protein